MLDGFCDVAEEYLLDALYDDFSEEPFELVCDDGSFDFTDETSERNQGGR